MNKFFMHPVERVAISGRFIPGQHGGIDYGWERGHQTDTKILAAASGKVVKVDYGTLVGNYVVIYHGERDGKDIYTRYLHMSSVNVGAGEHVNIGEVIGIMGATGTDCYGVHLHFDYVPCNKGEGFVLSRRIDPAPYLYVYEDQRYIEDQDGVKLQFAGMKISEASAPEKPSVEIADFYTYIVRPGDAMYKIAEAHGVTLDALKAANPNIDDYDLIHAGDRINIPGTANAKVYIVQAGDAMYKIAEAHGVTLDAIKDANPDIENYDLIYEGQKINIPV